MYAANWPLGFRHSRRTALFWKPRSPPPWLIPLRCSIRRSQLARHLVRSRNRPLLGVYAVSAMFASDVSQSRRGIHTVRTLPPSYSNRSTVSESSFGFSWIRRASLTVSVFVTRYANLLVLSFSASPT